VINWENKIKWGVVKKLLVATNSTPKDLADWFRLITDKAEDNTPCCEFPYMGKYGFFSEHWGINFAIESVNGEGFDYGITIPAPIKGRHMSIYNVRDIIWRDRPEGHRLADAIIHHFAVMK